MSEDTLNKLSGFAKKQNKGADRFYKDQKKSDKAELRWLKDIAGSLDDIRKTVAGGRGSGVGRGPGRVGRGVPRNMQQGGMINEPASGYRQVAGKTAGSGRLTAAQIANRLSKAELGATREMGLLESALERKRRALEASNISNVDVTGLVQAAQKHISTLQTVRTMGDDAKDASVKASKAVADAAGESKKAINDLARQLEGLSTTGALGELSRQVSTLARDVNNDAKGAFEGLLEAIKAVNDVKLSIEVGGLEQAALGLDRLLTGVQKLSEKFQGVSQDAKDMAKVISEAKVGDVSTATKSSATPGRPQVSGGAKPISLSQDTIGKISSALNKELKFFRDAMKVTGGPTVHREGNRLTKKQLQQSGDKATDKTVAASVDFSELLGLPQQTASAIKSALKGSNDDLIEAQREYMGAIVDAIRSFRPEVGASTTLDDSFVKASTQSAKWGRGAYLELEDISTLLGPVADMGHEATKARSIYTHDIHVVESLEIVVDKLNDIRRSIENSSIGPGYTTTSTNELRDRSADMAREALALNNASSGRGTPTSTSRSPTGPSTPTGASGIGGLSGRALNVMAVQRVLSEFGNMLKRMQDAAKSHSQYRVEARAAGRSGMLGQQMSFGGIERVRGQLNLTREEFASFAQLAQQSAMDGVMGVDQMTDSLKKLQEAYGGIQTDKLKEMVDLVKAIPSIEQDLKISASVDSKAMAFMAAAETGKLEILIDAQNAGLLGGISTIEQSNDERMLNAIRSADKNIDDIKGMLASYFPASLAGIASYLQYGADAFSFGYTAHTMFKEAGSQIRSIVGVARGGGGASAATWNVANAGNAAYSQVIASGGTKAAATAAMNAATTGFTGNVAAAGGLSGIAGSALSGVGIAFAANEIGNILSGVGKQWENDGNRGGAAAMQFGAAGARIGGMAWGGAKIGGLAGTLIGGPAGTAIGGAIGGFVGGVAGLVLSIGDLKDGFRNLGSAIGDWWNNIPDKDALRKMMVGYGRALIEQQNKLQQAAVSYQKHTKAIENAANSFVSKLHGFGNEVGSAQLDNLTNIGGTAGEFQTAIEQITTSTSGQFNALMRDFGAVRKSILSDANFNSREGTRMRQMALLKLHKAEMEAAQKFANDMAQVVSKAMNRADVQFNRTAIDAMNKISEAMQGNQSGSMADYISASGIAQSTQQLAAAFDSMRLAVEVNTKIEEEFASKLSEKIKGIDESGIVGNKANRRRFMTDAGAETDFAKEQIISGDALLKGRYREIEIIESGAARFEDAFKNSAIALEASVASISDRIARKEKELEDKNLTSEQRETINREIRSLTKTREDTRKAMDAAKMEGGSFGDVLKAMESIGIKTQANVVDAMQKAADGDYSTMVGNVNYRSTAGVNDFNAILSAIMSGNVDKFQADEGDRARLGAVLDMISRAVLNKSATDVDAIHTSAGLTANQKIAQQVKQLRSLSLDASVATMKNLGQSVEHITTATNNTVQALNKLWESIDNSKRVGDATKRLDVFSEDRERMVAMGDSAGFEAMFDTTMERVAAIRDGIIAVENDIEAQIGALESQKKMIVGRISQTTSKMIEGLNKTGIDGGAKSSLMSLMTDLNNSVDDEEKFIATGEKLRDALLNAIAGISADIFDAQNSGDAATADRLTRERQILESSLTTVQGQIGPLKQLNQAIHDAPYKRMKKEAEATKAAMNAVSDSLGLIANRFKESFDGRALQHQIEGFGLDLEFFSEWGSDIQIAGAAWNGLRGQITMAARQEQDAIAMRTKALQIMSQFGADTTEYKAAAVELENANKLMKQARNNIVASFKQIDQAAEVITRRVDIQMDAVQSRKEFVESIGGDFQEILNLTARSVQLERNKLDIMNYQLAKYEELAAAGNLSAEDSMKMERLRVDIQKQGYAVQKAAMGAQRDAYEKLLGYAFGQIRNARGARRQMDGDWRAFGRSTAKSPGGINMQNSGRVQNLEEQQLSRLAGGGQNNVANRMSLGGAMNASIGDLAGKAKTGDAVLDVNVEQRDLLTDIRDALVNNETATRRMGVASGKHLKNIDTNTKNSAKTPAQIEHDKRTIEKHNKINELEKRYASATSDAERATIAREVRDAHDDLNTHNNTPPPPPAPDATVVQAAVPPVPPKPVHDVDSFMKGFGETRTASVRNDMWTALKGHKVTRHAFPKTEQETQDERRIEAWKKLQAAQRATLTGGYDISGRRIAHSGQNSDAGKALIAAYQEYRRIDPTFNGGNGITYADLQNYNLQSLLPASVTQPNEEMKRALAEYTTERNAMQPVAGRYNTDTTRVVAAANKLNEVYAKHGYVGPVSSSAINSGSNIDWTQSSTSPTNREFTNPTVFDPTKAFSTPTQRSQQTHDFVAAFQKYHTERMQRDPTFVGVDIEGFMKSYFPEYASAAVDQDEITAKLAAIDAELTDIGTYDINDKNQRVNTTGRYRAAEDVWRREHGTTTDEATRSIRDDWLRTIKAADARRKELEQEKAALQTQAQIPQQTISGFDMQRQYLIDNFGSFVQTDDAGANEEIRRLLTSIPTFDEIETTSGVRDRLTELSSAGDAHGPVVAEQYKKWLEENANARIVAIEHADRVKLEETQRSEQAERERLRIHGEAVANINAISQKREQFATDPEYREELEARRIASRREGAGAHNRTIEAFHEYELSRDHGPKTEEERAIYDEVNKQSSEHDSVVARGQEVRAKMSPQERREAKRREDEERVRASDGALRMIYGERGGYSVSETKEGEESGVFQRDGTEIRRSRDIQRAREAVAREQRRLDALDERSGSDRALDQQEAKLDAARKHLATLEATASNGKIQDGLRRLEIGESPTYSETSTEPKRQTMPRHAPEAASDMFNKTGIYGGVNQIADGTNVASPLSGAIEQGQAQGEMARPINNIEVSVFLGGRQLTPEVVSIMETQAIQGGPGVAPLQKRFVS